MTQEPAWGGLAEEIWDNLIIKINNDGIRL